MTSYLTFGASIISRNPLENYINGFGERDKYRIFTGKISFIENLYDYENNNPPAHAPGCGSGARMYDLVV